MAFGIDEPVKATHEFMATMRLPRNPPDDILAAIDVGTNAVRLELAHALPDGALETIHQERDPVRPGEGVFTSGAISKEAANRLISTLRRYNELCHRYGAKVRAVATAAVREARNRDEIVRRARKEAGLHLEVISGREEARLISVGVLHGKAPTARSLCVDIGGGSTEVSFAYGETPKQLWSIHLGAVRLTDMFSAQGPVAKPKLKLMRKFAREAFEDNLPRRIPRAPSSAVGSSGTIGAVVAFARSEGVGHATAAEVSRAVERLAAMEMEKRRKRFEPRRADIIVSGAVILEAFMKHLRLEAITAVDRGLREGLLRDLLRKEKVDHDDHSLSEEAMEIGRRFDFPEAHSIQVARIALELFDDLASLHQLPAAARPILEVAALLHDVGHVVNYQRHHKHSQYVIENADLPGMAEGERRLAGLIARFHRRSNPEASHEALTGLAAADVRLVRKCATLLRVADALDRGHHQPVRKVSAAVKGKSVVVRLRARGPVDLELWDAAHELALFREVFGHSLTFQTAR